MTFVSIVRYVIHNCLSFAANKHTTVFLTVWICHAWTIYKKFQFHFLHYNYKMNHLKFQRPQISTFWWFVLPLCSFLFSISSNTFWLKNFVNLKIIWLITFNAGLVKLIHSIILGYNNNSTQNQISIYWKKFCTRR